MFVVVIVVIVSKQDTTQCLSKIKRKYCGMRMNNHGSCIKMDTASESNVE
jgi:hypothetical protein